MERKELVERYGPWVLITGASEGTGSAFARQLAAEGLNLILIARREGPLAALADEIRSAHGVECVTASIDLSADDAAGKVIAAAGNREVGLFIANAGADCNGSLFLDNAIANWDQLVMLNIVTSMRLAHHVGQTMRARGRGGILLVGSGACYGGLPSIAVYAGAKAFLQCFAEGLWSELRHYGVDVLNLVMDRTDTPAHRQLMERAGMPVPEGLAKAEDVAAVGLARLPHGPVHNWGQEDDVAGYAPNSAAARRERIIAIEDMVRGYAGKRQEQGA